ncbi:Transmembrane protein [Hirschfeldia incana]|nr:Transmembrane protein [Hirschfeldia incana]
MSKKNLAIVQRFTLLLFQGLVCFARRSKLDQTIAQMLALRKELNFISRLVLLRQVYFSVVDGMNTDSKGRGWYGKIYRKLETILVEVDSLAAQGKVSLSSSDSPGLDSLRDDEQEKLKEDHCSRAEQGDCTQKATNSLCRNDPKSSQACNDNDAFVSPSGNCTGDSTTEAQAAPGHDKMANMRSFSNNSMMVNQDEFFIEDFDEAPLDTIDLYDMTFREDPSDFDDSLLYAARDRSRQHRSFKVLSLSPIQNLAFNSNV